LEQLHLLFRPGEAGRPSTIKHCRYQHRVDPGFPERCGFLCFCCFPVI
jgi:hypothetical protein